MVTQTEASPVDTLLKVLLIVTITMMGTNIVETIFILSVRMSLVAGIIITEARKRLMREINVPQVQYSQESLIGKMAE